MVVSLNSRLESNNEERRQLGRDLGVVAASEDHLRRTVPAKATTFEDCIHF